MTDDVSIVPSICVFDVNKTLLDIDAIRRCFRGCLATGGSCASGLDSSFSIQTP